MSEDLAKNCLISKDALVTAFWNAVVLPEHLHIPFALVDNFIKQAFDTFDVQRRGSIDYRELFAAITLFQVNIRLPVIRLVRSWYHAWDGDSKGGLTAWEFKRMMATLAVDEAQRWEVERHVEEDLPALMHASCALFEGRKSLTEIMATWADAKRLSKRLGEGYVKTVVASGDEPPAFLPVMWSPYDAELTRKEKREQKIHIDVLSEWMRTWATRKYIVHVTAQCATRRPRAPFPGVLLSSCAGEKAGLRALLQEWRIARTHPVYREEYHAWVAARRKAEEEARKYGAPAGAASKWVHPSTNS
ncbi:EF-hand domain-containing protein [archaeon]|nr:MAG: EF-hand domain-containing protein [archaeon]